MSQDRLYLKVGLVLIHACLCFTPAYAEPPPEVVWNVTYDNPHKDIAFDVAVDDSGFVYVTGYTWPIQPTYCRTIRYSPEGEEVWNEIYDLGEEYRNMSFAIATDDAGFIYITGQTGNNYIGYTTYPDFLLIKYDLEGDTVWTRTYNVDDYNVAEDIAVDRSGFIYITGHSGIQEIPDHGEPQAGPFDIVTVKYDSEGNFVWKKPYDSNEDDQSFGIAVDGEGCVYVAGATDRGSAGYDYLTFKYDPDGAVVWKRYYSTDDDDWAYGVAVSADGCVYVTGKSGPYGGPYDYLTVKYDSEGNELWSEVFDNGGDDVAQDIAVDADGFIYLTGWSHNGSHYTWRTIKYDPDGNIRWEKVWDSGSPEVANGIAVDKDGFIYVTGHGEEWFFRTIKYRQLLGIEEVGMSVFPDMSLDCTIGSSAHIHCHVPVTSQVNLSVYDASGRRITTLENTSKPAGHYVYTWTSNEPGVFFIRLNSSGQIRTEKFISLR
jgi:hypothetical protein